MFFDNDWSPYVTFDNVFTVTKLWQILPWLLHLQVVIVDGFIALRWLYRVLAPYNAYQWWVPAEQRAVQCQLVYGVGLLRKSNAAGYFITQSSLKSTFYLILNSFKSMGTIQKIQAIIKRSGDGVTAEALESALGHSRQYIVRLLGRLISEGKIHKRGKQEPRSTTLVSNRKNSIVSNWSRKGRICQRVRFSKKFVRECN